MSTFKRLLNIGSGLRAYLAATAAVGLLTLLMLPFRQALSTSTISLLFLLPVLWISSVYGRGTGLFTGLLSFLTFNFLFIPPYLTFAVHQAADVIALLVFFLVANVIGQLVGQAKQNLRELSERERELVALYDLTLALAGQNGIREITELMAGRTVKEFKADAVEVRFLGTEDQPPVASISPASILRGRPADLVIPMASKAKDLGEMRIWRKDIGFSANEDRELQTFAAQGTMALERALLEKSETKAKVLEESDRLKSALLSSVSHEFNTPLATIKASVTSLLGEQVNWDTAARDELLTMVDEETDYLNRLVGNLLNMSRIESNALRPLIQPNVLSEIIETAVARLQRNLAQFRLEIDIPDDLPSIPTDFSQIEQVFINLLSNSIKYARDDTRIQISATTNLTNVEIAITNQGPPVPEADLEHIFEKFYPMSHGEQVSGTGLGLSICKGIVEAHGGKIWALNLPEGFSIRFILPLETKNSPSPLVANHS